MTTGVNVDFILNCFFTCKDRALERDRPYQREKKNLLSSADQVKLDMTQSSTAPQIDRPTIINSHCHHLNALGLLTFYDSNSLALDTPQLTRPSARDVLSTSVDILTFADF